ncbi:HNH endonuclease signature motif containing protein, partial [Specibacter cremeus]|uniref:HNH endonuclease signature motif containing protein n=1 Tax=Specibacter cremeus TaxID=1629051 RepID=UPI001F0CA52B
MDTAASLLLGHGNPRREDAQGGGDASGPSFTVGADGTVIDPATGPRPRADILVTVPFLSLLGLTDEQGELAGYGPIPASIARLLAGDCPSFLRVLTDPVTGEPLDVHPDRYRVTTAMRRRLQARDQYCTFPNCTQRAVTADVDHIVPWEDGGPTTMANLQCLCARHHYLKHRGDRKDQDGKRPLNWRSLPTIRRWRPTMTGGGRVGWTSPSGRYYPPPPSHQSPPRYPDWLAEQI